MKKWLLVLCTTLLPVVAVSANAGTVFPPELFQFIQPSTPPVDEAPDPGQGVDGPTFPNNGLTPYRDQFREWLASQGGRNSGAGAPGVVTPPAAVPLPAAAWLFGSALIALAGVARRGRR